MLNIIPICDTLVNIHLISKGITLYQLSINSPFAYLNILTHNTSKIITFYYFLRENSIDLYTIDLKPDKIENMNTF